MALDPLRSVSRALASEAAIEGGVPIACAGAVWYLLYRTLSTPSAGRPLADIEVLVLLAAAMAVTGWAIARQLHVMHKRTLKMALLPPMFVGALSLTGLLFAVRSRFEELCTGELLGALIDVVPFGTGASPMVACQINAVPGNLYLPGTLIYPFWSGDIPRSTWLILLTLSPVESHLARQFPRRPLLLLWSP